MNAVITGSISTIGMGLVAIGGGLGIGLVGFAYMQAIARQPELAGKLQVGMLIVAAFIEGIALFGAVLCFVK